MFAPAIMPVTAGKNTEKQLKKLWLIIVVGSVVKFGSHIEFSSKMLAKFDVFVI